MRLPLDRARHAALFELLRELEQRGAHAVLVGGLVPPLLLAHLDPDADASDPRRTADCDLVLHLPITGGAATYAAVLELLARSWKPAHRVNQFRWNHDSGLRLDLIPVPVGVERGDQAAVELARSWSADIDVQSFYRAQEYAIETAHDVIVLDPTDAPQPLRIAGLVAMLAMKLQAWNDSYRGRQRDAHDVAWLLRYVDARLAIAALTEARRHRRDLVQYIVEHLRRDFADEWAQGLRHYAAEAFPDRYRRAEEETEGDRNAVAAAVRRLLGAMADEPRT